MKGSLPALIKQIVFISLCSLSSIAFAQDNQPVKIFIDTNFRRVLNENEAAMVAYVGRPSGSDLYRLVAYDLWGNKLSNAAFKDFDLQVREGETLAYEYIFDEQGYVYGTYLARKLNYHDNLLDGEATYYNENQQVLSKANYTAGKLDGDFIAFNIYGKPATVGKYQNGVKEGDWLMDDGKRIYTYKNGKVVAKSKAQPQR